MIPFDRLPASEAPLEKVEQGRSQGLDRSQTEVGEGRARHGTLPPPRWTAGDRPSAATVVLRPLSRRADGRADYAFMRARVRDARAANDESALRTASATLARWLASRDRDLDEAVE